MDFNSFKIKYAETMLNYQAVEHDIKFIYAYMLKGNVDKHFESIENKTLGQMIRLLRDLDYSDDNPLISKSDYNFLIQICDNRNHWAHSVFTSFIYTKDFIYSDKYQKECLKLEKDHERIERASQILEEIRIDYCKRHRR